MRQERRRHLLMLFPLGGLLLSLLSSTVLAKPGLLGIGRKTLGGTMVFSDEVVYQDWRIQKHAAIGHFRLIDPNNILVKVATFDDCVAVTPIAIAD